MVTVAYKAGSYIHDEVLVDLDHVGLSHGVAWHEYPNSWSIVHSARFRNVRLVNPQKWGSRSHGVQDEVWVDCHATDVEVEHGWYKNLVRARDPSQVVAMVNCSARRCGGQAFQVACREHETRPEDWGYHALIALVRFVAEDTALRPDHQGAFAISVHHPDGMPPGFPTALGNRPPSWEFDGGVVLKECLVDNTMQLHSKGCVMVKGRHSVDVRGSVFRRTSGAPGPVSASNTLHTGQQQFGEFQGRGAHGGLLGGPSRLILAHNTFEELEESDYARLIITDFDEVQLHPNNKGNVRVVLNGEDLGPIEKASRL